MSPRSTIRNHAERSVPHEVARILVEGHAAHVGFVENGQPFVIPLGYQFSEETPDRIYFHGSLGSRAMRLMASGAPVCVTVTTLQGLVYSRTALNHSMNYRSAVCFGRGRRVMDEAVQRKVYEEMVRRYFPDRTEGRDYAAPTEAHLDATALIEIEIEESSAKMRTGGPLGPLDAVDGAPGTCGVVEL